MSTPPRPPKARIRRTRRVVAVGSAATLASAWVVVAGLGHSAASTAGAGTPAPAPAPSSDQLAPAAQSSSASTQSALPSATTRQS